METFDFSGRVERVYLARAENKSSKGWCHENFEVRVSNGQKYIGKSCLVRFDIKQLNNRYLPISNFLTSTIPPGFESLSPEEYILCAQWTKDMKSDRGIPSPNELNRYYNPGSIGWYFFLKSGFNAKHGKLSVNCNNIYPKHLSLSKIIEKELPDPKRSARLMVAEDRKDLEKIMTEVIKLGLTPIELEPLL